MNDSYLEVLKQYEGEVTNVRRGRGAWICEYPDGPRLLKEYRGTVKRLEFEDAVLGQLEEVQSDPIANVRLNIAKALGQLKDQFTEDAKVKRVVPLLERYSKDPDRDVSFFA